MGQMTEDWAILMALLEAAQDTMDREGTCRIPLQFTKSSTFLTAFDRTNLRNDAKPVNQEKTAGTLTISN